MSIAGEWTKTIKDASHSIPLSSATILHRSGRLPSPTSASPERMCAKKGSVKSLHGRSPAQVSVEQCEHLAPATLGRGMVVNREVRHHPAVRGAGVAFKITPPRVYQCRSF